VLNEAEKTHVASVLETDAQVVSNSHLNALLQGQPKDVQAEIIRINTDARHRSLQFALLVPVLAGLLGLGASFRMVKQPDPVSSSSTEGMSFG